MSFNTDVQVLEEQLYFPGFFRSNQRKRALEYLRNRTLLGDDGYQIIVEELGRMPMRSELTQFANEFREYNFNLEALHRIVKSYLILSQFSQEVIRQCGRRDTTSEELEEEVLRRYGLIGTKAEVSLPFGWNVIIGVDDGENAGVVSLSSDSFAVREDLRGLLLYIKEKFA